MDEKTKVLAVDDEKFNLMLLKGCLKSDRYEITGCTNAVEALQEFKRSYFDIVLLDVLMPGIDGFELRKLIRQIDKEKPIIFLTALVDDINTTMLNQISWDSHTYYMNKSYSKKLLDSKIQQAVEIHRSRRLATDYYKRLEAEMALAGDLQKILLPNWCVLDENMTVCSLYQPNSKVSGDIFEIFRISGSKYLFFIGDIAGHGVQAALYMSAIQAFLKVSSIGREIEVHELLNQLNRFLCNELVSSTYMTCMVAKIDFETNRISLHSAGHPTLLGCTRHSGEIREFGDLEKGGVPVGWFPETVYGEENTCEYEFDDDTIFIAQTDGIDDVCNKENECLDKATYREILGMLSENSDAITLPYRLRKSFEQLGYDNAPDDVTLVAIQKKSKDPDLFEELIPSQISMVSKIAIKFAGVVEERTGQLEAVTKVELLVHEYLNNVIIHGLEMQKNAKNCIYISMLIKEHEITLRGIDRGKFWDFNGAFRENAGAGATTEADPSSPATSGRGLQILRDITSHIVYNTYCGLNETIFVMKY